MSAGRFVVRFSQRELELLLAALMALQNLLNEAPEGDGLDKIEAKLTAAYNREDEE